MKKGLTKKSKKRICLAVCSVVGTLLLGGAITAGAMAYTVDINHVKRETVLEGYNGYETIKQQVENNIQNGDIDLTCYDFFKTMKSENLPAEKDYHALDTSTLFGKVAENLAYYAAYISVNLDNLQLNPDTLPTEQQLILRNECYQIIDEIKMREKNLYAKFSNLSAEEKVSLDNLYFRLLEELRKYVEERFPTDYDRKFAEEFNNVRRLLTIEKNSAVNSHNESVAERYLNLLEELKSQVDDGAVNSENGLAEINRLWDEHSREYIWDEPSDY